MTQTTGQLFKNFEGRIRVGPLDLTVKVEYQQGGIPPLRVSVGKSTRVIYPNSAPTYSEVQDAVYLTTCAELKRLDYLDVQIGTISEIASRLMNKERNCFT